MFKKYFTIIFILISFITFAEDGVREETTAPVISMDVDLPLTVGGCVNVITGSFFFHEQDIVDFGYCTLDFQRSYDSSSIEISDELGMGTKSNYSLRLQHANKVRKRPERIVITDDPLGIPVCLYYNINYLEVHKSNFKFGYMDCLKSPLGAAHSMRNAKVEFSGKNIGGSWTVFLPNGGRRRYENSSFARNQTFYSSLVREDFPDGHSTIFEYDNDDHRVVKATKYSPDGTKKYGSLNFDYAGDEVVLRHGNGQKIKYNLVNTEHEKVKMPLITHVSADHIVDTEYEYQHNYRWTHIDDNNAFKYSKVKKPDGRYLKIDYEGQRTKNNRGRVVNIGGPVGQGGSYAAIYSFKYGSGRTEVEDVLGRKDNYLCSQDSYLLAHHVYIAESKLLRMEKFSWDKGLLLCKASCKKNNKAAHLLKFTYDDLANIVSRTEYGSRNDNCGFVLDDDLSLLEPVTSYSISYTYSGDEFHLLLGETHDNGLETVYEYIPGTNLIKAKLLKAAGEIYQREFYEYDEDNILIKKIEDDGFLKEKNKLSGVTSRRIVEIIPQKDPSLPGYTQPREVVEKYYSFSSQKECLSSRIVNHFNSFDQITKQDFYDEENSYIYSIEQCYDERMLLVKELDQEGKSKEYDYDDNHNKILERFIDGGMEIHYTYDLVDRLVQKETVYQDGSRDVLKYSYDLMGNMLSASDRYANTTNYEYDSIGRLTKVIDPCGYEEGYGYDYNDNVISETDKNGNTTNYQYNSFDQVIKIIYPDNSTELYQYYPDGKIFRQYHKNGSFVEYLYDAQRRVIEERTCDKNDEVLRVIYNRYYGDKLTVSIDAMGIETIFKYDDMGRKIEEATLNNRKSLGYDRQGRLNQEKTYYSQNNFLVSENIFDNLDRVILQKTEDNQVNMFGKTTYSYDVWGNALSEVNFLGEDKCRINEFVYDDRGNIIKEIDPEGSEWVSRYDYDFLNNKGERVLLVTKTDPKGIRTIEEKDICGRLSKKIIENGEGKRLSFSECFYDSIGQESRRIDHKIVDGEDRGEFDVVFEYDSMGNKTAETEQPGSTSEKKTGYGIL
jgi:YD repeat-containing protein